MRQMDYVTSGRTRNPGFAAVLSAILPGLGQIYNGRILWAISNCKFKIKRWEEGVQG